jgi:hypothetical protein
MAGGAIQFVADTSQFNAPLAEASKAALNVAASAEQARQRIVTAYQQQVKAAQDAGASQAQLTAITNRASSQLASVTEDNARRYINAIDRMEDRTRRFNAARQTLGAATVTPPVSSFNLGGYTGEIQAARELATAVHGVNSAHSSGVSAGVQFGSVIRGLEGNFSRNVRAAEAFGSTLSFLTPVIAAAFPVVGALTLGYALVEMGRHAYEAFENIVNLRSAIEGINQLQISTDVGHNRAGEQQENSVESILGTTANRSTSLQQRLSYQSQQPFDLSSYFYSDQFKKLPDDVKGTFEKTYKNVAPADAQSRIQQITKTVNDLQAALNGVQNHTIGAFLPVINGSGPSASRNPADYYRAQLTIAQQIRTGLTDQNDVRTASLQSTQTDIGSAKAEEAKEASDKLIAAQKKSASEQLQQWEEDNSDWKAAQDRSLLQDAAWWQARLDTLNKGSVNYRTVQRKVNNDVIADNRSTAEAISKFTANYNEDFFKSGGLSKSDSDNLSQQGEAARNYIQSLRESIDLQKQNSDAIAESSLKMAVATGQMTKLDAAQLLANIHTQDYNRALQELKDQRDSISTSPEFNNSPLARQAALQDNTNRTNALNTNRSIQSAQDTQSVNPSASSPFVGATDALNEFVIASRDAAKQISEFTTSTISGFNDVLLKILTTRSTGFQNRQALGNFGAGLARNVAGIGLQHAEGTVLGALGFGGKPDGSAGKPLYVRIAGGITGAATTAASSVGNVISNSGGLLKSLVNILPHFAAGGPINGPALVGENGPELFNPGTSGTIIPNHQLSSVTGSTGHTFNIDARNSTDPAQTAAQVQRGIMQLLPHIGPMAVKAVNDNKRRTSSFS